METHSEGKQLRDAIERDCLQAPGVPFPLASKLIERAGFGAGYISGATFSAAELALPDVGLFTLTELVDFVRRTAQATALPLIVDADTGFGDAAMVERTIFELEAAGAAAIQLEDQISSKRCGHLGGKQIVSSDEMCERIAAAAVGRTDPQTVIIARTDARAELGLSAVADRAKAYLDAGADWIFPEALLSEDEFAHIAEAVDAPLVANMTEFGRSPLLNYSELKRWGYSIVLYPVTLLRLTLLAQQAALETIRTEGTQESLVDLMFTRNDLYDLLDYELPETMLPSQPHD